VKDSSLWWQGDNNVKENLSLKLDDLIDDTTPELGGDLNLGGKHTYEDFTAGATIAVGDLVTMDSDLTDGEFYLADADDESRVNSLMGIARSAGTDGGAMEVITEGLVTGLSGITVGKPYYVSSTAGDISTTPPASGSWARIIGYGRSTTSIYFKPGTEWVKVK